MSRFDDDLNPKNEKFKIKGHTKNDELNKIDKEYKETGDAMRALQAKKEVENKKYDEAHKIGRKPEKVIRQSDKQEEVDMESFFNDFKKYADDLDVIKNRHAYTAEEYKEMGREFFLEELEEKLPELFNGPTQLIFMNKDDVHIDEEVFNNLSEDKRDLLEEECFKGNKQLYVNSQG